MEEAIIKTLNDLDDVRERLHRAIAEKDIPLVARGHVECALSDLNILERRLRRSLPTGHALHLPSGA